MRDVKTIAREVRLLRKGIEALNPSADDIPGVDGCGRAGYTSRAGTIRSRIVGFFGLQRSCTVANGYHYSGLEDVEARGY